MREDLEEEIKRAKIAVQNKRARGDVLGYNAVCFEDIALMIEAMEGGAR